MIVLITLILILIVFIKYKSIKLYLILYKILLEKARISRILITKSKQEVQKLPALINV